MFVLTMCRPAVEQANLPAPAFARVFKEMILVTHPDKPLPRAGKGTIIRKQAIALYEKEIDTLYVLNYIDHGTTRH